MCGPTLAVLSGDAPAHVTASEAISALTSPRASDSSNRSVITSQSPSAECRNSASPASSPPTSTARACRVVPVWPGTSRADRGRPRRGVPGRSFVRRSARPPAIRHPNERGFGCDELRGVQHDRTQLVGTCPRGIAAPSAGTAPGPSLRLQLRPVRFHRRARSAERVDSRFPAAPARWSPASVPLPHAAVPMAISDSTATTKAILTLTFVAPMAATVRRGHSAANHENYAVESSWSSVTCDVCRRPSRQKPMDRPMISFMIWVVPP